MRLRPSGRQGPLATQFRSFIAYQASEAQTWEHMALTRARVLAGDPDACGRRRRRDPSDAVSGARDQRRCRPTSARCAPSWRKEKGDSAFWDFKLVAGGLLDVEFLAQFLVLRHAHRHPSLLVQAPLAVIERAGAEGLLDAAEADALIDAYRIQTALAQLTRLTVEDNFDPAKAGVGVIRRLCAAANQPDLSALTSALADMRIAVRAILRRHLAWTE